MPGRQSRRWCGTLNNYTADEESKVQDQAMSLCCFAIYGREVSGSGTRHLQLYCELKRKKTLGGMKRTFGQRWHFEIAVGTSQQNSTYCSKDGNVWRFGEPMSQGRRRDLEDCKRLLDNGSSMAELAESHFGLFLQYRRGFTAYASMRSPRRCWKSVVTLLTGPTGTGKSFSAHENAAARGEFWVYPGKGWFDGFHGQVTAIFDDFDGKDLDFRMLLRVLDRYPMEVPVKGGHVNWNPRYIFITSNAFPDEWYPEVPERDMAALKRRIEFTHKLLVRYNE